MKKPRRLLRPGAPPMRKRLLKSFFDRSVHEVAPDLIGATLLFKGVGGIDRRSRGLPPHGPGVRTPFNGKTARNAVMFGPPRGMSTFIGHTASTGA